MTTIFSKAPPADDAAGGGAPNLDSLSHDALTVAAVEYKRKETQTCVLEWSRVKDDYVYHWKPKHPVTVDEKVIAGRIMVACADLVPKTVRANIDFPVPELEVHIYTVRLYKIAQLPGAERICEEKLVEVLCALDGWTPGPPPKGVFAD